jgi:hypothetical protein
MATTEENVGGADGPFYQPYSLRRPILDTDLPAGERPWRALAAAIIIQALQDAQAGRPCTRANCNTLQGHTCARRAWHFLHSPECADLLVALGLNPAHLSHLPELVPNLDLAVKRPERVKLKQPAEQAQTLTGRERIKRMRSFTDDKLLMDWMAGRISSREALEQTQLRLIVSRNDIEQLKREVESLKLALATLIAHQQGLVQTKFDNPAPTNHNHSG